MVLWRHASYGRPVAERQHSRKTTVKELDKMEKEKIILEKFLPVLYVNSVFGIKTFNK